MHNSLYIYSYLWSLLGIIKPIFTNEIPVGLPKLLNTDLFQYERCLKLFHKSQPVWSWVVMHEADKKQPFEYLLNTIYKVGVPLYNYEEPSALKEYNRNWFYPHLNISTMSYESKIFIMSKNKFHITLRSSGVGSFRTGDKILFTNYNKGGRIDFKSIVSYFGMEGSDEGLTRYNLLPIVSFLFLNTSGEVDPITYIPTNRLDILQASEVHLTCDKLYYNSIDKLIFNVEYFTISAFETVHALRDGNDFYGKDAIIGKILVKSTRFPYVFRHPPHGETYGNEKNHSGAYKEVVKGLAQMSLNSRLFVTTIMTDNVVEYTYPYNRDDLVILIPVRLLETKPFYASSYAIGITLLIIIMLYLYFKFVKEPMSLIEVIIVYLLVCSGKPIQEINTKYFRIIYMSMMLLAFYGYTLFSIRILSELTLKPAEVGVKSVKEFARTNYIVYSAGNIKNVLVDSLHGTMVKKIPSRIVTLSNKNDDRIIEKKLQNCSSDYAVICRKSTALYYLELSNAQNKDFCYNIVPEPIMPSLVTYILGYRSPFQDKFNHLLARIIEHGLVANYTDNQAKKKVAISDDVKPISLDFRSQNEGLVWIILIFGCTFAICSFLIEIFIWPYVEACLNKY